MRTLKFFNRLQQIIGSEDEEAETSIFLIALAVFHPLGSRERAVLLTA